MTTESKKLLEGQPVAAVPLRWTKNPPTKSGFYWCLCSGTLNPRKFKSVVKVYSSNPRSEEVNTVFWDGENFPITHDHFHMWSDAPITEPVES